MPPERLVSSTQYASELCEQYAVRVPRAPYCANCLLQYASAIFFFLHLVYTVCNTTQPLVFCGRYWPVFGAVRSHLLTCVMSV